MSKLEWEKERNQQGKGRELVRERQCQEARCWRGGLAEALGDRADEKPQDLTVREMVTFKGGVSAETGRYASLIPITAKPPI